MGLSKMQNIKFSGFFPLLDSSQDKNLDDKPHEDQVLEFNTEYYIVYPIISDNKEKVPAS